MNARRRFACTPPALVVILGAALGSSLAGPTLTAITLDGDMGDWATVLANPQNVVTDGPGEGLVDADAPGGASLDIDKVAFTWDATHVYFYVHRQSSSGELDFFWFHFDTDNDGYVADSSPLLGVSWWGTHRRVSTTLDTYKAANAATGDKISGAGGKHDGFRLPGTRGAGAAIETINSGSVSGLEMETRISWAALAVVPGTALQWHVSSTRRAKDYPGAIVDNSGASAAFAGVDLSPDRAVTALPGTSLAMAHNIRNTGNINDTFDLTWTSTGGFSPSLVNFYLDADGSGTFTQGDTLLIDTNGNGLTDTGAMTGSSGPKPILAVARIPYSAVKGQVCVITIKTRSSVTTAARASDTAIDTVTIDQPAIALFSSVDEAADTPRAWYHGAAFIPSGP